MPLKFRAKYGILFEFCSIKFEKMHLFDLVTLRIADFEAHRSQANLRLNNISEYLPFELKLGNNSSASPRPIKEQSKLIGLIVVALKKLVRKKKSDPKIGRS